MSTHRLALYRPNGSGGYVAGVAYQDNNGNGYYDAGEGYGVTVNIRDWAGNGTTVDTDAEGAFSEYLPNGQYTFPSRRAGSSSAAGRSASTIRMIGPTWPSAGRIRCPRRGRRPGRPRSSWRRRSLRVDLGQPTITGPGGPLGDLAPDHDLDRGGRREWVPGAGGRSDRRDDEPVPRRDRGQAGLDGAERPGERAVVPRLGAGRSRRHPRPVGTPEDFSIDRPTPTGPATG